MPDQQRRRQLQLRHGPPDEQRKVARMARPARPLRLPVARQVRRRHLQRLRQRVVERQPPHRPRRVVQPDRARPRAPLQHPQAQPRHTHRRLAVRLLGRRHSTLPGRCARTWGAPGAWRRTRASDAFLCTNHPQGRKIAAGANVSRLLHHGRKGGREPQRGARKVPLFMSRAQAVVAQPRLGKDGPGARDDARR